MKIKQLLVILLLSKIASAVVITQNFNITLNQQPQTENIMFSTWQQSLYQVDYFGNGALSFAGKNTNEFISTLYVKSVGGSNFTPVKMYNNKSVKTGDNWKSTPVFVINPGLGFTSEFPAQGNVYMGGRVVFKQSADTFYLWFLVNLNEQGNVFTIIKAGFEDMPGNDIFTENEGQNEPSTGINKLTDFHLNVFPNPTSEVLNIQVNNQLNYSYQLLNLEGKQLIANIGSNNTTLNVAHLPKGIYLLKINANGAILNRKIILE